MTTLRRYKPFPKVEDLDPGIEPGWDFDVLCLPAEPEDKVGSVFIADETKDDERAAVTEWMIVGISPTAFTSQEWSATGQPCPFAPGDVVITKRYPPGTEVTGHDGRAYRLLKDKEILAKRIPGKTASVKAAA